MHKEWVLVYTECDRMFGRDDSMKTVIIPLKAKCQDDAIKEGEKLWGERLKEGEDDHGAKRIGNRFFYPHNPRVRLEVPILREPKFK